MIQYIMYECWQMSETDRLTKTIPRKLCTVKDRKEVVQ